MERANFGYHKPQSKIRKDIDLLLLFPLIKGRSGTDIWTENLTRSLTEHGVRSKTQIYPLRACLYPSRPISGVPSSDYLVVHANSWFGYSFSGPYPLVVTEHTGIHDPLIRRYKTIGQIAYHTWVRYTEAKTLKRAGSIVCVSKYAKKILEDTFSSSNARVIYNGIDPELFSPVNRDDLKPYINPEEKAKYTLFFAGNQTRMKGYDTLLAIGKALGDDYCIYTSSGLKTNRVEKVTKNVYSVGTLSKQEMVRWYSLADIYLFPSRMEGFGLTVTEAMACERPIVATDYASIPEIVDQEKGGLLCGMNDIKGFVSAIKYLAEDEVEREKMGRYNRRKVLDFFTLSKMTDQYIEIYQSLLS